MSDPSSHLRLARLSLQILARTVGPWPVVGLLLWCLAASIQEPSFFRVQGLDIQWPAVSAGADLCCLALALVWSQVNGSQRARLFSASTYSVIISGVVLLVACCATLALAVAAGVLADQAIGSATSWGALAALLVRGLLVWAPMALLTVGITGAAPLPARQVLIIAGYSWLIAVHPVSLLQPPVVLDKFTGSALAFVGSGLIAAMGTRAGSTSD